jgi:hypothetical protein
MSKCLIVGNHCANCGAFSDIPDVQRCCPFVTGRPGTELSKLLKRVGIEPTPTCACRAKAAEMDAWGCDECSKPERIEEVVAVMREEAKARGLPFLDLPARLLVRRAIHNARKAEAKRASEEASQAAAEGPAA